MVAAYTLRVKLALRGAHGVVEISLIFADFGIYIVLEQYFLVMPYYTINVAWFH